VKNPLFLAPQNQSFLLVTWGRLQRSLEELSLEEECQVRPAYEWFASSPAGTTGQSAPPGAHETCGCPSGIRAFARAQIARTGIHQPVCPQRANHRLQ